jgi:hypothetical protein
VLTYTHSIQPTILNDNVNQFKVGLETDKGHFTVNIKTVMLMSHFFARSSTRGIAHFPTFDKLYVTISTYTVWKLELE